MSSKGQMTREIFQFFTWQFVAVHITRRKFLKDVRWSYLSLVIKHALFPLGTTCILMRCSNLWEVCVKTFAKKSNPFTTPSCCNAMTSSKVSYISGHFRISWNLKAMVLNVCVQTVTPICLKIPSNLLHMELTPT